MLPKSRRNALRCPTLEQLEVRLCLSVDPIFSEGVLTVNGSRDNDSIVISDNGQGVVSVHEGTNAKQNWNFRGVERIVVDAGEGDDAIRFTRGGGAQLPIPELDIQAGDGNDEVFIGLLLPAVQKVREAAARVNVNLGEGDNRLRANTTGVDHLEFDLTAGGGDDEILIGMLLPAVQKVREASARMHFDLGAGNDTLKANTSGIENLDLELTADGGDDEILIGMLLPAVQKVRDSAARVKVDLGAGDDTLGIDATGFSKLEIIADAGAGHDHIRHRFFALVDRTQLNVQTSLGLGNDSLTLDTRGYREIKTDIDTGLAGDGVDQINAIHVSPTARNGSIRRPIVTLLDDGQDTSKLLAVGYETVDVSTEQTRQVTVIQDL